MFKNNKIVCIPENDKHKRFLLGQHGTRELLAIGLNPSTANEHKLVTSRNIKAIHRTMIMMVMAHKLIRTSNENQNLPLKAVKLLVIKTCLMISHSTIRAYILTI